MRHAAAIRRSYSGCALLILLGLSSLARADSAPEARAALKAGDRLRDAGELHGALERYTAAHATLREPPSGLRLARTQAALGMLIEARQTAAETAALAVTAAEPAEFAEARNAAEQLVGEIEPRLPLFDVLVSPAVEYTLRIDGVLVPERAHNLRFRTNPGDHVLEIEASGYLPAKQTFTLSEGVRQLFQISLSPVTATATAPAPPPPIAAEPESSDEAQRTRGYIALTVGSAVLTLGAIAGVMSLTETSNAKHDCPDDVCPERLRGTLETADTLANVANFALPIGLIGVAYGLYELLTAQEQPEPAKAQSGLSLRIDARGAYATLRGAL